MSASKQLVIVVGAGPGIGLSVARLFAKNQHPVALLARTQEKVEGYAKQIQEENNDPNRARGYAVDASSAEGVAQFFQAIKADFSGTYVHTGIFNPGGGFSMASFRSTSLENFTAAWETQAKGAFIFAQHFLEAVESGPEWGSGADTASANLLITGATASVRGGPKFSAFSPAKFALRSLGQSLAREYGPKGVHVAHIIVDGVIESERISKAFGPAKSEHSRLDSDQIAEVYLQLARQKKAVWTQEIDIRPSKESF